MPQEATQSFFSREYKACISSLENTTIARAAWRRWRTEISYAPAEQGNARLDPDREQAAGEYEMLRGKPITFFRYRDCAEPESGPRMV